MNPCLRSNDILSLSSLVKPALFVFVFGFAISKYIYIYYIYYFVIGHLEPSGWFKIKQKINKIPISSWATFKSPVNTTGFLVSNSFKYLQNSLSHFILFGKVFNPAPAFGISKIFEILVTKIIEKLKDLEYYK